MIEALPNLESRQDFEEIVFHLKGAIEAMEVIAEQAKVLDKSVETDLSAAMDAIGRLYAEIFVHLLYHIKQLRYPFRHTFRALCSELGPDEQDEQDEQAPTNETP